MTRLNQILLLFILIISGSFSGSSASAQVKRDTLKVLFVGNSYTYVQNLPQVVSIISDSTKTKLITRKSTIGGAYLSEHWFGKRGLKTKEIITKGKFDIVILQENSMAPIQQPDSTIKYANLLCQFIKASGAKPCFYMTWAREKVPQYQGEISNVYSRIAKDNGAILVPVGKAWELAMKLRPTINLYDPDGSHPSGLGAILSAYVFVGALTGEVPASIPGWYGIKDIDGESVQLMSIDNLDAMFFRKVTEQTLRESGLLKF
jgi:hypothetical protein